LWNLLQLTASKTLQSLPEKYSLLAYEALMTSRHLFIACILGLVACGTATAQKKHPLESWSGLVKEDAVGQLPKPVKTKGQFGVFASAVITDNKTLAKFSAAAAPGFPQGPQADLNLDKLALIVVVFEKNTNALKWGSYSLGDDGVGTLQTRWVGVEPFYRGSFPATCHFVPKKGLKKVRVALTDGKALAEIDIE
jgi:hypothetical protein